MEETAARDLDAIRRMVLTWKGSYCQGAPPDGGGEYLAQEFAEEIQTYVYPYVKRLLETSYLSEVEAREFLDYCYSEVEDLLNHIKAKEAG